MAEIASAFVTLAPSAKGFGSKLDSQIGGDVDASGKKSGRRFGAVFAKAGGLIAAAGIGLYLKGTISAASDLAESQSKVGVVFGKSAGQIMKASQTSARAMGLSKQAYLEATGTFGNLLVSLDLGPKKAANMSQQMVKLAGDLASFNNVSPDEALDALKSGLTGETEPLKRFGVNMNDATLHTEALKLGLIKNVKDALTPQNKALAAQSLIMHQTKTAQGDFARTSGGLANQQRILAANMENTKAAIGKFLLPFAIKAVTALNGLGGVTSKVGKVFGDMFGPKVTQASGAFQTFIGKAIPVVKQFATTLIANLMPVLRQMGQTFTTLILPAISRFIAYVVANVLPILRQMVTVFVTNVLPVIKTLALFIYGTLVPAIIKIVTSIAGSLKPVFDELFAQIQKTVLPIVTKLLEKFREWWPTIKKVIVIVLVIVGALLKLAAIILGKVLPPLIRFAGFLIRTVFTVIIAVIGVIVKIVAAIIKIGGAIGTAIGWFGRFSKAVDAKIRAALGFIKDLPGKAKDALGNLSSLLVDKGKDIVQGLIDGIKKMGSKLAGFVKDFVKDHIPGPVAHVLGISSPSKVMAEQARWIPLGMVKGIDSQASVVDAAMIRLASRVRVSAPRLGFDVASGSAANAASGNTFQVYETQNPSATARQIERHLAFAGGS